MVNTQIECKFGVTYELVTTMDNYSTVLCLTSMLWYCWLGVKKSTRPGNIAWWGASYLSGAKCKWFAYGPADATATPSSLASLWSPYVIGQTIIFFLSFFPRLSQRSETGCLPYFHTWCGLSANLECTSQMCCTRLAENTGRKKVAKNRHLGTIAQICWAISSQLSHVSTIGKSSDVLHMSPQYGERQPISGWDRSGSLRHPCKFQRVSRLGN